jgi:hypothetical protein
MTNDFWLSGTLNQVEQKQMTTLIKMANNFSNHMWHVVKLCKNKWHPSQDDQWFVVKHDI